MAKSKNNFKEKLNNALHKLLVGTKELAKKVFKKTKEIAVKAYNGFLSSKIFWTAFSILVILLIISIVILGIRLNDYTKVDDREVSLRSTMDETFNVFGMEYKNDVGEITVKGYDGEKIIAPGTDVEYTLRIRNTDKVALDYHFSPKVNLTSEHKLPIVIRLLDPEDKYVIGNETTWVALDEIGDVTCSGTLIKNQTAEYVFQWKWPYESGDDAYDSFLGTATDTDDIGVNISFDLHSQANADAKYNGGFFKSMAGNVTILVIILLLLIAVITLLIIYVINKSREKQDKEPIIVEVPVIKIVEKYIRETVSAPKLGFSGKMEYVNLDTLNEHFNSGSYITIGILKKEGLVPKSAKQMKILARSNSYLDKAFIIETQGISKNAEELIKKAGGRVIIAHPDR